MTRTLTQLSGNVIRNVAHYFVFAERLEFVTRASENGVCSLVKRMQNDENGKRLDKETEIRR